MSNMPKKNELVISPSTIKTIEIAQYFDIDIKVLNKIFIELQWIQRKYFLWLATTQRGEEKGAKKEKRKILWNRSILGDRELILAIKASKHTNTTVKTIDLDEYKAIINKKYTKEGYTVWDYSKEKGDYDRNIHFVVKKDKDVTLIHCQNNQEDIRIDDVVDFRRNKKEFIRENPVFEFYNIKIKFCMEYFSLSEEAFKYLQKHNDVLSYEIIK